MTSGNLVRFPGSSKFLVLDAWPVMEWLKKREPAAAHFRQVLAEASARELKLALSSINLGEVYYGALRELGTSRAEEFFLEFRSLPIRIDHPTVSDVLAGARIKAAFPISYADTFAAVLASELSAPVLTGDKDFRLLEAAGTINLRWCGA